MLVPWLLCGALAAAVLLLLLKLRLLHKSMGEISAQLQDRLSCDTNTLLSLSSRDRHARRLAARAHISYSHAMQFMRIAANISDKPCAHI